MVCHSPTEYLCRAVDVWSCTERAFESLVWKCLAKLTVNILLERTAESNCQLLRRVAVLLDHFSSCETMRHIVLAFRVDVAPFAPDATQAGDELSDPSFDVIRKLRSMTLLQSIEVQSSGHPLADSIQRLLADMWCGDHDGRNTEPPTFITGQSLPT